MERRLVYTATYIEPKRSAREGHIIITSRGIEIVGLSLEGREYFSKEEIKSVTPTTGRLAIDLHEGESRIIGLVARDSDTFSPQDGQPFELSPPTNSLELRRLLNAEGYTVPSTTFSGCLGQLNVVCAACLVILTMVAWWEVTKKTIIRDFDSNFYEELQILIPLVVVVGGWGLLIRGRQPEMSTVRRLSLYLPIVALPAVIAWAWWLS